MSKQLVIYHGNCKDGWTAAWACWKRFGDAAEYFPAGYSAGGADVQLPDVTGRDVVMVDFCTGREQLLRLKESAASLLVLDHHKTAEAACAGLDFCVFDMEQSGAGLAWRHFHPGMPEPWQVSYAEDHDLWRFKLPLSKAVNAALAGMPMESFELWEHDLPDTAAEAALQGAAVLAYIDRYVGEMAKQARSLPFAGHDVPIVNAPYINTSELVGHLAQSAPFAVGWFQRGDGKYQISLRSRGAEGVDVSEIAKAHGGGGHRNAAGFACDRLPW
jgi:oligoribonuclease NrnB/cAMP/cGMP phosphodiesterase (DHH superfamily)